MEIKITENKIEIGAYITPINTVSYYISPSKDSVTYYINKIETLSSRIDQTTVNGAQMTTDNIADLLADLFFLQIEIKDITGLRGELENKADLVNGKVPESQLPTYVDQIIEGTLVSDTDFEVDGLVITPEQGKIYVDTITNLTYRWSGSIYDEISKKLALGTTEHTAFRGDYGQTAYNHSQKVSGNPHKVTKTDVGLSNVDNTSDLNKPVSTKQQAAIKEAIQIGGRNYSRDFRIWASDGVQITLITNNEAQIKLTGSRNGACGSNTIKRIGNCLIAIHLKTTEATSMYIGTRASSVINYTHTSYFSKNDNGSVYYNLPANFDDTVVLYVNYTSWINANFFVGIVYGNSSNQITISYPTLIKSIDYIGWTPASEDI